MQLAVLLDRDAEGRDVVGDPERREKGRGEKGELKNAGIG